MPDLDLDSLGILANTDKSSLGWDYLRHYERQFAALRHETFNLLEIGVWHGDSLRLWEKYFPKATVVGIDIDPDCATHAGGRKRVEIGSQTDAAFLADVAARYPPTVVIDDGSHVADHVQVSFEALFPALLPGGCYVIEDMAAHPAGSFFRGSAALDTPEYIQQLVAHVNAPRGGAWLSPAQRAAVKAIDTVMVTYAAAFIWKKPTGDLESVIRAREALADRSDTVANWQGLARFILGAGGPTERVRAALDRAARLAPGSHENHFLMGITLEREGNIPGAIAATAESLRLAPSHTPSRVRLATLEKRAPR
jgi:hypothetical protein